MPSIDAHGHALAYGSTGGYDAQRAGLKGSALGIAIFDDKSEVRSEVYEILDLVREARGVLATSHLSAAEIVTLVPVAFGGARQHRYSQPTQTTVQV